MKKVSFENKPTPPSNMDVDRWVKDRTVVMREATKRLTIDVPVNLHKRIKSQCAMQDLVMADVIRDLLEERFPATIIPGSKS